MDGGLAMKVRLIALVVITAAMIIASCDQLDARALPNTSRAAIDAAYEEGAIDFDRMILLKAYTIYAPEELPLEFRGHDPDKCGTATAREIEEALTLVEAEIATEIRGMRARPVCDTSYDTAHFRIHYDTSGPHMIYGWPSTTYRDAIATALENCWTEETVTIGFREPPSDGTDPDGGGGNGLYDVYLQDLTGVYGYCQGSYTVPATARIDCTSYVVIDNDYAGFGYPDPVDPMKVTVAHEFCHSCQYSHDYTEPTWYLECTSTWVEDVIYDSIDDYRGYVFYFYNYPYASLDWNDGTGLRMYGSCVWNFFLMEHVSIDVIPDIWYACETAGDLWSKMNSVLGSHGTSLEEEFKEFAIWSWFTGSRNDGTHFEEGAFWPLVAAERTYTTYPVIAGGPISAHRPDHLAWNYIHMSNPGGSEDVLDVTYDGPSTGGFPNFACLNTKTNAGVTDEFGEINLNGWGNGNSSVGAWDGLQQVALVAVNVSTSSNDMSYTVDADRATPVGGSFYAVVVEGEDDVTLRWTLAEPATVEHLDVYRATSSDGPYELMNDTPIAPVSPGAYVDGEVEPGDSLWYRLMATMWDGSEDIVANAAQITIDGSLGVSLRPPMPNPFRDGTVFEFTVPFDSARATLTVYDVRGRVVATVVDDVRGKGRHTASWQGIDSRGVKVPAGIYFCSLQVGDAVVTQKAMVLR
jgi:hypothetical protein